MALCSLLFFLPVLSLLQKLHWVEALRFLDGCDAVLLLLELDNERGLPSALLLRGLLGLGL